MIAAVVKRLQVAKKQTLVLAAARSSLYLKMIFNLPNLWGKLLNSQHIIFRAMTVISKVQGPKVKQRQHRVKIEPRPC